MSEKDQGQAHAINKGLTHCTGEIFNWLNSVDYLEQGALFKIAEAFEEEQVQLVAGVVCNFLNTEIEIIPNQYLSAEGLMCWYPGVKFVQPGVWMRKDLIRQCGGIDEQFHYSFDWDLYIRYLYHFPFVKEISDIIVHFRLHDNSKTQSMQEEFIVEERKIIEKISKLEGFDNLHKICQFKIQKTGWTDYLSQLSKSSEPFLNKVVKVFFKMPIYIEVSFSIQTLGAIRALWNKKVI